MSWDRLAGWLYRHRGWTAAPLAILLLVAARPTPAAFAAGLPLIAAGELLRIWAVTHIGPPSRGRSLRAPRLVTSGPYALLRHPLYTGNALLCLGLVVTARPGWFWVGPLLAGLFIGQTALLIRREESFLRNAFPVEWPAYRAGLIPLSAGRAGRLGPFVTGAALRLESPTLRTVASLVALLWLRGRVGL